MRRGTTPDYLLTVSGYDLTVCTVYVTIAQTTEMVTLTGNRLEISYDEQTDVSSVVFYLTQEETLNLKSGSANVQIRFIQENGEAFATDIRRIAVLPILKEGVISYEGD